MGAEDRQPPVLSRDAGEGWRDGRRGRGGGGKEGGTERWAEGWRGGGRAEMPARRKGRAQTNQKWILRPPGRQGRLGQRLGLEALTRLGRGLTVWRGKAKGREPPGVWRWKTSVSGVWEAGRGRDERKGTWGARWRPCFCGNNCNLHLKFVQTPPTSAHSTGQTLGSKASVAVLQPTLVSLLRMASPQAPGPGRLCGASARWRGPGVRRPAGLGSTEPRGRRQLPAAQALASKVQAVHRQLGALCPQESCVLGVPQQAGPGRTRGSGPRALGIAAPSPVPSLPGRGEREGAGKAGNGAQRPECPRGARPAPSSSVTSTLHGHPLGQANSPGTGQCARSVCFHREHRRTDRPVS